MSNENSPQNKKEGQESRLEVRVGKDTIPSDKHPESNEDAVLELDDAFAVFDGVGGQKGGNEASRLARQAVKEGLATIAPGLSAEETVDALKKVLEEANRRVLEEATGELKGMAATVSLVKLAEGNRAAVANLGDSRVYVLRGGEGRLEQITLDDNQAFLAAESEDAARTLQSKFNNLTDPSKLSEAELAAFRNRNVILQALGGSTIRPRTYIIDLQPGDKLLLSSDGIHDNLTDLEIEKILTEGASPETLARVLSSAAQEVARVGKEKNVRSKMDDISALVVEVGSSAEAPEGNLAPIEEVARESVDADQEALKSRVAATQSVDELVAAIDKYDAIKTSSGGLIPREEVQACIREVVAETLDPDFVPRYGGLRARAVELRDQKKREAVQERLGGAQ